MRRFVVFALLAALPAPVLLSPTLASAAVSTYSYQITGGTGYRYDDPYAHPEDVVSWSITGGKFTVLFPTSVCSACTDVRLLSLSVQGASGGSVATANFLAQLNPAVTGRHNTPANDRWAAWTLSGESARFGFVLNHPSVGVIPPTFQAFSYGPLTVNGSFYAPPFILLHMTAQEVAVPEPSAGAMLATVGVMLGAYALRRARRRLR